MRVKIVGTLRRRERIGFGPFKREKWNEEPIAWSSVPSEATAGNMDLVVPDVKIGVEIKEKTLFVRARIRDRNYILAECPENTARALPFSVLSTGGLELSGRIEFLVGEGSSR